MAQNKQNPYSNEADYTKEKIYLSKPKNDLNGVAPHIKRRSTNNIIWLEGEASYEGDENVEQCLIPYTKGHSNKN